MRRKVFAGGLWDEDTKLVRFGVREYDPEVGRWTSKEPLGFAGSKNFYVYAGNDSVNWVDVDGLNPFKKTRINAMGLANRSFGAGVFDLFSDFVPRYSRILGVCLARKYLKEWGSPYIAWGKAENDRKTSKGYSEELRNAEHYLYAYHSVKDGTYRGPNHYSIPKGIFSWLFFNFILTPGYSLKKFYSNNFSNNDVFRVSRATGDELAAGLAGANDAMFGFDIDICGCE